VKNPTVGNSLKGGEKKRRNFRSPAFQGGGVNDWPKRKRKWKGQKREREPTETQNLKGRQILVFFFGRGKNCGRTKELQGMWRGGPRKRNEDRSRGTLGNMKHARSERRMRNPTEDTEGGASRMIKGFNEKALESEAPMGRKRRVQGASGKNTSRVF